MVARVRDVADGDEPPLPVLMDARLDAARVREREAAKATPLISFRLHSPVIGMPASSVEPRNPWHMLAESLPADATTVRPYKPLRHFVSGSASPERSRFRYGSVGFDESGFTLSGVGVTPVGWLKQVGGIGCVAGLALVGVSCWSLNQPWMYRAYPTLMLLFTVCSAVALLAFLLENAVTEQRRGANRQTVPWSDLLEAQWERDLRWVVLVYRSHDAKIQSLPLGNLTPAHAAALWDVLWEYVPGRSRPATTVSESNPRTLVPVLVILGSLFGFLTLIAWQGSHP